ncbi:MAG TPA: chemotaxis protein CheB [Candidatus Angelobacter sp.]|nr:chemotaxis protein CheB [Candidatus Angelobacter sp.]
MPRKKRSRLEIPDYSRRRYDVVAMGSSAGGLNALTHVLRSLPKNFPSSIVVVQHLSPEHKSWIASLLGRSAQVKVKQAEHGEIMLPGTVYTAPPDEHLLVGPGKIQLAHSQLVHFSRPSIDLLFESVAGTYGSRAVGVVLSGSGRDGSTGIRAIKEAGGIAIAQDPETAEFRPMPQAAVDTGCIDFVLPLEKIGSTLIELCA